MSVTQIFADSTTLRSLEYVSSFLSVLLTVGRRKVPKNAALEDLCKIWPALCTSQNSTATPKCHSFVEAE
jgi:hypothetical protein